MQSKSFLILHITLIFILAVCVSSVYAEETVESGYTDYASCEGEECQYSYDPANEGWTQGEISTDERTDGWITIDPVDDIKKGSSLSVSGTTNLGDDCTICLVVLKEGETNEMIRDERPVEGDSDSNSWSFNGLDSSWFDPGYYTIRVTVYYNGHELAESEAGFTVNENYITVEDIGDVYSGQVVIIKGAAMLPGGESLIVRVFPTPYSGGYESGYIFEGTVTPSDDGAWSVEMDTAGFEENGYFLVAKISGSEEFPKAETDFKVYMPQDVINEISDCTVGDTITVSGCAPSSLNGAVDIYLVPFSSIPKELLNSQAEPTKSDYASRSVAHSTVAIDGSNGEFSADFNTAGFECGEYLMIADLSSGECMTETFTVYSDGEYTATSSQDSDSSGDEDLEQEVEMLRKKLEEKEQVIAEQEEIIEEQKGIIESLMNLLSGLFG